MKLVRQSVKIVSYEKDALQKIEYAGRVAYKSHDKIKSQSYKRFVRLLLDNKHLSVLEHSSVSFIGVTDRGVSHELVRHRLASYTQESTRYCNYSLDKFDNQLTFVIPVWFETYLTGIDDNYYSYTGPDYEAFKIWYDAMAKAEEYYLSLVKYLPPEKSRQVLPLSIKTEIYATMNLRELRHFLELRTKKDVHPQMRQFALDLLKQVKEIIPIVFDDIGG